MRVVIDRPADVAAWVAIRIPMMDGEFSAIKWAIGIESEEGKPLGGLVFTNHMPAYRNIEVSVASESPRWLTRNILRQLLAYPFDQLDCNRITTVTPRKAASARRFLEVFGFKREGLIRHGFGSDDAVISGLLRKEWLRSSWYTGRVDGQIRSQRAHARRSYGGRQRANRVQQGDGAVSIAAE